MTDSNHKPKIVNIGQVIGETDAQLFIRAIKEANKLGLEGYRVDDMMQAQNVQLPDLIILQLRGQPPPPVVGPSTWVSVKAYFKRLLLREKEESRER